jgi:hypothetical protein
MSPTFWLPIFQQKWNTLSKTSLTSQWALMNKSTSENTGGLPFGFLVVRVRYLPIPLRPQNSQSSSRLSLALFSLLLVQTIPFVTFKRNRACSTRFYFPARFSCSQMTQSSLLRPFISVLQCLQQNLHTLLSCHGLLQLGTGVSCPYKPLITPHHFARLLDWALSLKMVCFHDIFQYYADLASRSPILL